MFSSLLLHYLQWIVCLGMGAVTEDLFPSQHATEGVSIGAGFLNLKELQRDWATTITAGILWVTGWNVDKNGRGVIFLILFYLNSRNPDQSLKPWCRVQRGKRIVREFCHIPTCKADIGNLKIIQNIVCLMWFISNKLCFLLPRRFYTNSETTNCCGYR